MDTQRFILVTLLVKLGVAAAISSALVRSRIFKLLLFREERTLSQKIQLILFIGIPFALGVMVRGSVHNFLAADLSFESAILLGIIGGRVTGVLGGTFISLPALAHGEWLMLPLNALAGLGAGMLRNVVSDWESVWSFSPFIDLSIYRWLRRNISRPQFNWHTSFFLYILLAQFVRMELGHAFPRYVFSLDTSNWAVRMAIYATSVLVIATVLKVWNNTRIELKLEEQERLLLNARMQALQSQINPHFLFNTLNSVSSLVRFDPEGARDLIVKLANILRRLLRKGDAFVQLREELEFIDDYLDIEVVRFGPEKLRVKKELDPESLDLMVPSMLLQPLVENSIKHGLTPKLDGGRICLRSKIADGRLQIEIEDDGVGMSTFTPGEREDATSGSDAGIGIGMANVAERLHVVYGDAASMVVESPAGDGTVIRISIPVLQTLEAGTSTIAAIYEARSSTPR